MKKILILGGARAQVKLIETAKAMGIYVVVVGIPGEYPGYKLADKYYPVDIFDKESVLKVCQEEQINGISMVCSDFGLQTVGYVCDILNLKGLSEKSAIVSSNKLLMKQEFEKKGVRTAKFRIVKSDDDVKEIIKQLSFPLITKSVDLQGSRGIYVSKNEKELLVNYQKSINESKEDYCIIEEYIEGEEFGAQAFINDGEILFVLLHGDLLYNSGQTKIPIGHYTPFLQKQSYLVEKITALCKASIQALELNNCAVNIDIIIKDDEPYILEIAGRAGANYLPELVSTYLGINYYKLILLSAIGEDVKEYYATTTITEKTILSKMLYSSKSGLLSKISIPKDVEIFVEPNDYIDKFTNSKDCIGQTLCVGETLEECMRIMDERIENIKLFFK